MTQILPRNLMSRKPAWMGDAGLVGRLVMVAILVLVAVGAFGLGRLTTLEEDKGSLRVYAPTSAAPLPLAVPVPKSANNTPSQQTVSSAVHNFVASKNGSKYYPADCKSSSRIKAENQVWFETSAAALSAGYSLASGCSAK